MFLSLLPSQLMFHLCEIARLLYTLDTVWLWTRHKQHFLWLLWTVQIDFRVLWSTSDFITELLILNKARPWARIFTNSHLWISASRPRVHYNVNPAITQQGDQWKDQASQISTFLEGQWLQSLVAWAKTAFWYLSQKPKECLAFSCGAITQLRWSIITASVQDILVPSLLQLPVLVMLLWC